MDKIYIQFGIGASANVNIYSGGLNPIGKR